MSQISVIIPTYQHAATIGMCIRLLLEQTVTPKEIIVVDDGSYDHTKEVVSEFAGQIQYIYQSNQGAPIARNYGAQIATGAYLLFCDADVFALPNMLARLAEALEEQPEASYAYASFRWGTKLFRAKPFDPLALQRQNYIHTTSLIRANAFPGFDPRLKRFQDWDLWLTMLEQGQVGVAVEEELFRITDVKGRTGISTWMPSWVYRFPWRLVGWKPKPLRDYEAAKDILAQKHVLL